jgi:hypothetical protein
MKPLEGPSRGAVLLGRWHVWLNKLLRSGFLPAQSLPAMEEGAAGRIADRALRRRRVISTISAMKHRPNRAVGARRSAAGGPPSRGLCQSLTRWPANHAEIRIKINEAMARRSEQNDQHPVLILPRGP